jgi:hypothetical protein
MAKIERYSKVEEGKVVSAEPGTKCPYCPPEHAKKTLMLEVDTINIYDSHGKGTLMHVVRCKRCKTFLSLFDPHDREKKY